MQRKKLNKGQLSFLFAIVSFLVGLLFRLSLVARVDFPYNDGGMFTQIVEELLANGFKWPYVTEYNFLDIPLAYPPLGFYLAAILVKITGSEPIVMIQFLPAIISSFTIPAFYFLSKTILPSYKNPYLSTIIYALVPQSWQWLIMGGGLTRSLGLVFSIPAILCTFLYFSQNEKRNLIFAVVFSSLTILSHPETGFFLVLSIILARTLSLKNWKGVYKLFLLGGLIFVFTSPWWLSGIIRYGIPPYLAAFSTGGFSFRFVQHLFLFGITGEIKSFNIAVLAILGFFYLMKEKQYFMPIWLLIILIFTPRAGFTFAMLPVSIMAGISLSEIIIPALNSSYTTSKPESDLLDTKLKPTNLILLSYLLISLLLSVYLQPYASDSKLYTLSENERETMTWISENTPPDSNFIILTGKTIWDDEVNEWFPYLAKRYSISTLQGSEWLSDDSFIRKYYFYIEANQCLNDPENCLEPLAKKYNLTYTHIYLPMETSSSGQETQAMYIYLKYLSEFPLVYEDSGAAIFFRSDP